MKIKNKYSEKIYWRAFKGDDTVYTVGLAQGSADPGGEDSWRDDSFPSIKVEVKTGDIVFSKKVLARAGRTFNITDDLVVDKEGQLDVAKVELKQAALVSERRTDVQFFDARNFNETTTREITFSIENAFSASRGFQQGHEHSQTWTVGGNVGGELGIKDKKSGGSAAVNAEVSVQFEDKVVESLQNSYSEQVSKVWKQSVSDKFTFQPGKIYAIEVTWDVEIQEGMVSYFDQQASYSVVSSAKGNLTTPSAYLSVAEMPDDLKKKFEAFQK